MSMMWVGIGAAVLGAGTSIYGSNKQSKDAKAAAAQNAASQGDVNAAQWAAYLMTRGVNPTGAATGQIPANPQAINARLPLWANVTRGPSGGGTLATSPAAYLTGTAPPTTAPTGGTYRRSWSGLGITR